MRVIAWVAYATLFLLLFGLAVNNQHEASIKGFFGAEWRAPTIVIVLLCFAAGALVTLLAMLPPILRKGSKPDTSAAASLGAAPARLSTPLTPPAASATFSAEAHPPRDGL